MLLFSRLSSAKILYCTKLKPSAVPYTLREALKQEISEMCKKEVIEEATGPSEWCVLIFFRRRIIKYDFAPLAHSNKRKRKRVISCF